VTDEQGTGRGAGGGSAAFILLFCLAALLMPAVVAVLDKEGITKWARDGNLRLFTFGWGLALGSAVLALVWPRRAWLSALLSVMGAIPVMLAALESVDSSPDPISQFDILARSLGTLLAGPLLILAAAPWILGGALVGAVPRLITTKLAAGRSNTKRTP
jgi:hypothetical protein